MATKRDGPRNGKRSTTHTLMRREKIAKAIEMRGRSKTWLEIADALGYTNEESIKQAVYTELRNRAEEVGEKLDEYRMHLFAQLDEMERELWAIVHKTHVTVSHGTVVKMQTTEINPDTGEKEEKWVIIEDDAPTMAAFDRLLKVQERRAKLLALDKPQRHEVGLNVSYSVNGVELEELK